MNLTLYRKFLHSECCEGELFVNGEFFCYTIEDVVRCGPGKWNSRYKVYAKTAIPYGHYPVKVTWSNRFKRRLTGVFNVPDFTGIRIHNGSSDKSSAGCIIVSYYKDDGPAGDRNKVVNDVGAMNDLCKMVMNVQDYQEVWIDIVKQ